MLDLNPYPYRSVDYFKYELMQKKRQLELVTEAATVRIRQATPEEACAVATEMSEAIVLATHSVSCAELSLKEAEANEAGGVKN